MVLLGAWGAWADGEDGAEEGEKEGGGGAWDARICESREASACRRRASPRRRGRDWGGRGGGHKREGYVRAWR